jgi:hypothetical protein
MLSGTISKFMVSVGGGIMSALSTYYGTARWEPAVGMGITALLVYLVPNTPKVTTPTPTPPPTTPGA